MSSTVEDSIVIPYEFGKTLFPRQVNGKLKTVEFLEASNGVVTLISKLGNAFSPLYKDMKKNIEKIRNCYEKNPAKYIFIEDMILCEKSLNDEDSLNALLWLQRALHFSLIFFQNIINDNKESESLQEHMTSAYSQTLEPYHSWITRNLFKFFKNLMPKRSDLLSTISEASEDGERENLMKFLKIYFQSLSESVSHIISFFQEYNLDSYAKV